MDDALRKYARVQKIREQAAQVQLAEAEGHRARTQEVIDGIEHAVSTSRSGRTTKDAADLARHHTWTLQMELRRRARLLELSQHDRVVESRRSRFVDARKATRTTELVVENIERTEQLEARRRDQLRGDERGVMAWWRNRGNR
jgi:hypothetical protein